MSSLPGNAFRRYDETPDDQFYQIPRLVTHIDDNAIAAVTQLYRDYFPANGVILDLMSSWVSHLPPEVQYSRVVGHGMNEAELRENKRLNSYFVQNLNANPVLPLGDGGFDGAGCTVSVQYLTRPVDVFREVGRVLKPGAPFVISFSNRCFPTKAVAIWQSLNDQQHGAYVARMLQEAGNWTDIEQLDRSTRRWRSDPLFAVVARSTGPYPQQ